MTESSPVQKSSSHYDLGEIIFMLSIISSVSVIRNLEIDAMFVRSENACALENLFKLKIKTRATVAPLES
jgi:hypothetical protein